MPSKFAAKLPVLAVMCLACLAVGSLAADNRPPAGQMCPEGAYVIGFDAGGNIVCSAVPGVVASKTTQAAPGVMGEGGHACPEGCTKAADDATADVAGSAPAASQASGREDSRVAGKDIGGPVISKIRPFGVVFGARETTIRIIGSGFTTGTIVKFQGVAYTPSVNTAGTELRVTIETRDLPMGRYAITVSNGDGLETTRRRALEVF